ncbi:MAG: penicillin-binding protein [Cytophagales bacterium]|nr:MAG: penicillin-binding protein [Cytophagales bacterium]
MKDSIFSSLKKYKTVVLQTPVVRFFVPKSTETKRQKWIRRYWSAFFVGLLASVLYFKAVEYNFLYLFGEMPSIESLERPKMPTASELYTADGVLLGRYFKENRTPVTYEQLSPYIIEALIATEDIRFHEHSGIDLKAIMAVAASIVGGDPRGGSTLTQQTVKNLFKMRGKESRGLLGNVPIINALIVKTKEWITAISLEKHFTKEEIMTMYLNTVDFGNSAFGIYTASKTFFNTTPQKLNAQQAALLVGLLKATTYYNPFRNHDNAFRRRNTVLYQMQRYGYLSANQYDSLTKLPIKAKLVIENSEEGAGTYFKNEMNKYLEEWCRQNGYDLYADGFKIYTTIDSRMQKLAEEAVAEKIAPLQKVFDNHWRGLVPWTNKRGEVLPNYIENVAQSTVWYKELAKKYAGKPDSIQAYLNRPKKMKVFSWNGETDTLLSPLDSIRYYKKFLHAGLMTLDPSSGNIKAWVGGINYKYFKYDHVMQAKRQPGSTFKPILYAAAIDSMGYSPCSRLVDAPVYIRYKENGEDKSWFPHNADWIFSYDSMTLRHAMGRSINSVAAKLTELIGWTTVAHYARRMGITSKLSEVPSISLGSSNVSLYEMVGAYGTFLNEGVWTEPMFITRIEDANGKIIHRFIPKRVAALKPESAFLMTYMLQGSLQEPMGTSGFLYAYPKLFGGNEIGGKTGTSTNNADGWYFGVTKDLVTGVWVGGDDRSIHFRNGNVGEGGRTALPVFATFMEKVYDHPELGITKGSFPKPSIKISKPYFCPTRIKPKPDSLNINLDSLQLLEDIDGL